MIANFPLTQVDQVLRRTLYSAAAIGIVGIAAAIGFSYLLAIPGIILGMLLAVMNHRVFQSTAMHFTTDDGIERRPFAGTVFLRLGLCTGVAIALLVLVQPMGWGVVFSLAVFQFMLLLNSIVALLRYQREGINTDA